MELCGCQNKEQMLRRLLNDLQQRIEGRNGQHVYLVNDIHTHFHLRRGVNGIVPEITDVIHAVIGGSVDFQYIHTGAGINGLASLAAVAGVPVIRIQAVDCLGKDLGATGFAGTPGAGKQISMAHSAADKLGFQRLGHRHLPGNIVESLRAVFTIKGLISGHTPLPFKMVWTNTKRPAHNKIAHPHLYKKCKKRLPCGTQKDPLNAAWFPT